MKETAPDAAEVSVEMFLWLAEELISHGIPSAIQHEILKETLWFDVKSYPDFFDICPQKNGVFHQNSG